MQTHPLCIITRRREAAERYSRAQRQWLAARNAWRRLHESAVLDLGALRSAALRLDQIERGRAAALSDLKALAD
ncbi:MAG: hypothetical protein JSR67_02070 [Proteobacteria bacterium]|nr:hypothetical protein [Pseudomonadota bacterium]